MIDADLYLPNIWHLPCLFACIGCFNCNWMTVIDDLNIWFQDYILEQKYMPPTWFKNYDRYLNTSFIKVIRLNKISRNIKTNNLLFLKNVKHIFIIKLILNKCLHIPNIWQKCLTSVTSDYRMFLWNKYTTLIKNEHNSY